MTIQRRAVMSVLVTSLLCASQLVLSPGAEATEWGCKLGATQTSWSEAKKPYKHIGLLTITLAAHTAYKHEETIERTNTLQASVTTKSEVSGNFKVKMLGKLETKVGLDMSALGSTTKSISMTDTFSIPGSSSQQTYVLFKGMRKGSGNWKWRKCINIRYGGPDDFRPGWSAWVKGKAASYGYTHKGVINCATSQKPGSLEALARAAGCN